jgi:hypothetical protein
MTARSDVLFITDKTKLLKSALGQKRRFDLLPMTSGLPLSTDILRVRRHVSNVPIVLQNSFCFTEYKFSGPYARRSNNHLRDYTIRR